jgi:hypothetical protein
MASVRAFNLSSGGWNRTSGLRVQSAASLPAATAPEFGKEDSNLHRLIQSQGAYRLADSRVESAPRESNPPVEPGKPAPDRSARDASTITSIECGIGESNPDRLVGSQESCPWTNPAEERRKERESNPQGSSLVRVRAGCRHHSACPSESSSSGGRNRTCVPPVNSRALVPARTPPDS